MTGDHLAVIVARAMDAFGVPSYRQSWHSDQETAGTIAASGLAAVTRTHAKVIADTDAIDLPEMRKPIARRSTEPGRK